MSSELKIAWHGDTRIILRLRTGSLNPRAYSQELSAKSPRLHEALQGVVRLEPSGLDPGRSDLDNGAYLDAAICVQVTLGLRSIAAIAAPARVQPDTLREVGEIDPEGMA